MAGETPRNWQIDLPHVRMQAVVARHLLCQLSGKNVDRREIVASRLLDLIAIRMRDRPMCDAAPKNRRRRRDVRRRVVTAVGRRRVPSLGIDNAAIGFTPIKKNHRFSAS